MQVENIGVQIEQPFEVLPLPHFCAAIKKHILDMVACHAEAKALALQSSMTPSPSQMVSTLPAPFLCECYAEHGAARLWPSSSAFMTTSLTLASMHPWPSSWIHASGKSLLARAPVCYAASCRRPGQGPCLVPENGPEYIQS